MDGGVWTDTTPCLLVNVGNHNRIIIRTTTRGDESPGHIIHLINVENRRYGGGYGDMIDRISLGGVDSRQQTKSTLLFTTDVP